MTVAFWLLCALMTLAAVALVLRPLLRGGAPRDPRLDALDRARREGVLDEAEYEAKRATLGDAPVAMPAVPRALPLLLVALLVASAFGLYRLVGEPRALDPAAIAATSAAAGGAAAGGNGTPAATPTLEDATVGLAKRLEDNPDDVEGWLLLGRAYKTMQRFGEARDALANAMRLAPDNADVMVEYAESLALAADDRRLGPEALALLGRALERDPAHQRGLWLRGIAALQDERYAEAVADWETLLAQMPPDSEVAESIKEQIAQARARAGMPALAERVAAPPAAAEPAPPPQETPAATAGPRLVVEVALAPEVAAKVAAGDTLFVFARAPQGSKMPLAIQRLPVPAFPATIVLDDSMGMMPALKLSQAGEVVVGARISRSGNAAAQSGDLEVISAPFAVAGRRDPVRLVIDRVVP
ncbi:MAG TPA: tetratricopeptide repeat protein [Xanthomonadales bacterium]|nr:tetratricopeptide repeat protein [Xanthomonadales bacterium]